jgi:hypothetical protein
VRSRCDEVALDRSEAGSHRAVRHLRGPLAARRRPAGIGVLEDKSYHAAPL